MTSSRRFILPIIAVLCYLVAFFLPALHLTGQIGTNGQPTYMSGFGAFFDGFFALFDRQYAWFANPLAVLALIFVLARLYSIGLILSIAALLIAQHTWIVVGTQISGDEGGVTKYLVTSLGMGFYLWTFSFLSLGVASFAGWMWDRRSAGIAQLAEMRS